MITFSIRESLKSGWELFKKHWMVFVAVVLISGIIENIPVWINEKSRIMNLLSLLITAFFMCGLVRLFLDTVDGKIPTIPALFSAGQYYLNMLGTLVLSAIVLGVGFLLLIVPGIYLSIRLMFATAFVVDKNMNPIEAMKASWAMTENRVMHFFKLWVVAVGLVIVGVLALLVGLLVAVPVVFLTLTLVYRKLNPQNAPLPQEAPQALPQ